MTRRTPVADRFWNRVDKDGANGCWLWTGSISKGYGKLGAENWYDSPLSAHRVSYEMENGKIPDGLFVCHKCDVRNCVNPDHLFLGTAKDNMQDCLSKGRFRTRTLHGEDHGSSKITAAIAREIKGAPGKYRDIGAMFGVSSGHVWKIKSGRLWKKECSI